MTPVELIGVIFAIVVLVKVILVMLLKAEIMTKVVESMFPKKVLMSAMCLIIAAVVGFYLLAELNPMQILAAALFGMVIYGLVLVQYPGALTNLAKRFLENKTKAWLPLVIFIVISLWVLYAAFV